MNFCVEILHCGDFFDQEIFRVGLYESGDITVRIFCLGIFSCEDLSGHRFIHVYSSIYLRCRISAP